MVLSLGGGARRIRGLRFVTSSSVASAAVFISSGRGWFLVGGFLVSALSLVSVGETSIGYVAAHGNRYSPIVVRTARCWPGAASGDRREADFIALATRSDGWRRLMWTPSTHRAEWTGPCHQRRIVVRIGVRLLISLRRRVAPRRSSSFALCVSGSQIPTAASRSPVEIPKTLEIAE